MTSTIELYLKETPLDYVGLTTSAIAFMAILISGYLSKRAIDNASKRALIADRISRIDLSVQDLIKIILKCDTENRHNVDFLSDIKHLSILIPSSNIDAKKIIELLKTNSWDSENEFILWKDKVTSTAASYYDQMTKMEN